MWWQENRSRDVSLLFGRAIIDVNVRRGSRRDAGDAAVDERDVGQVTRKAKLLLTVLGRALDGRPRNDRRRFYVVVDDHLEFAIDGDLEARGGSLSNDGE